MVNIETCSTKGCGNLSIDGIDGRCDVCFPPAPTPDYQGAYELLIEYYDCIPEEDREFVDEELKDCGL